MKRFSPTVVFCMLLSLAGSVASDQTTIALSGITRPGFRERVISDLIAQYDCCVLGRARGYNLAVEKSLATLAALDKLCTANETIPAADYAVAVEISPVGTSKMYYGLVKVFDIGNPESEAKAENFSAQPLPACRTNIVEIIASSLDLRSKRSSSSSTAIESASNLTWMVMPFLRFDIPTRYDGQIEGMDIFAHQLEFALQKSPSVWRLVDHNDIAAILTEHHLSTLQASEQSVARAIARIAGADRIITAVVAPSDNADRRVDIHLLDAHTAAIIDARIVECDSPDQIGDRAAAAVTEMAATAEPSSVIAASDTTALINEAKCYLSMRSRGNQPGALLQRLHNAEAAWLLAGYNRETFRTLIERLGYIVWGGMLHNTRPAEELALRSGLVLEHVLKPFKGRLDYHISDPAILLAEVKLELEMYDEALHLAQKHLKQRRPSEEERALYILSKANMELGNLDAASDFLNQIEKKYGLDGYAQELVTSRRNQRVLYLSRDIDKRKADQLADEEKFRRMRERMKNRGYQFLSNEWDTYMRLLRTLEGSRAAAEELDLWINMDPAERVQHAPYLRAKFGVAFQRADALLEQADCFLELGRKREAVQNYKALWEASIREPTRYQERCAEIFRMIQRVESEIGYVPEKWKPPGKFHPASGEFSIYIVPVGLVYTDGIEASARLLGRYFGGKVRILDAVPEPQNAFPDDSMVGKKELFWDGVLKSVFIPDDALFIAIATTRTLQGPHDSYDFSSCSFNMGNPVLITVKLPGGEQDTYQEWEKKYYAYHFADRAALAFHYLHREKVDDFGSQASEINLTGSRRCKFPCLFYEESNLCFSRIGTIMGLCPNCQEEYKHVDFEKIHRDLMNYLQTLGASVVNPKKVHYAEIDSEKGGDWYMQPLVGVPVANLRASSGEPGLRGDYFIGKNFETQVFSRVDSDINFRWDDGESPAEVIPHDGFSVQWTGTLTPNESDQYWFQTFSDDGVRLWIDGKRVIDNWSDHGVTFDASPGIALEAGRAYDIRLEFYENQLAAIIRLFWRRNPVSADR